MDLALRNEHLTMSYFAPFSEAFFQTSASGSAMDGWRMLFIQLVQVKFIEMVFVISQDLGPTFEIDLDK